MVDDELQQLGLAALEVFVDRASAALEFDQRKRAEHQHPGQRHRPARWLSGVGGMAVEAAHQLTGKPDRRRHAGSPFHDGGQFLQPRLIGLHLRGARATTLTCVVNRRKRPRPPGPGLRRAVTHLRDGDGRRTDPDRD
jgi:hypothetical protein